MAFSVLQLLLLENLTYTYDSSFPFNLLQSYEGQPLSSYLSAVRDEVLDQNARVNLGSYITGADWLKLFGAIRRDSALMEMQIATTHRDKAEGGGDGFSVIFLHEPSHQAIIAFKGTQGADEWVDNFMGATTTSQPDGVSTPQQCNALRWYQEKYLALGLSAYEITVIGHSKGGNKAKYLTLMDDTIDHCHSFDGQGFSDQFVEHYYNRIIERRPLINNHNVDRDFVNLLLNDFGNIQFYKGFQIGNGGGGFLENHCPNSFLLFLNGAQPLMVPAREGRAAGMERFDRYLNSMLRFMPEGQQACLSQMLGEVVIGARNGASPDYFIDLMSSEEYRHSAAYILAFTIEYLQHTPQLKQHLHYLLGYYHLQQLMKLLEGMVSLLQSSVFDPMLEGALALSSHLPDFARNQLIAMLKSRTGLELSNEQLSEILGILQLIPEIEKRISHIPDGRDKPWD